MRFYKDSGIRAVTSQASPPKRAKGGTNLCCLTPKTRALTEKWPGLCCLTLPGAPHSSATWPCVSWGQVSVTSGGRSLQPNFFDCWGSVHLLPGLVSAPSPSPTELMAAGVTQSPRHLIKGRGAEAVLKCHPISGHSSVYWYQQPRGQEPRFLIQYYEQREIGRGKLPDRFKGKQFSDYSTELPVSALQLEDSAMYLCASSLDTAPQGPWLSVPKPF